MTKTRHESYATTKTGVETDDGYKNSHNFDGVTVGGSEIER